MRHLHSVWAGKLALHEIYQEAEFIGSDPSARDFDVLGQRIANLLSVGREPVARGFSCVSFYPKPALFKGELAAFTLGAEQYYFLFQLGDDSVLFGEFDSSEVYESIIYWPVCGFDRHAGELERKGRRTENLPTRYFANN